MDAKQDSNVASSSYFTSLGIAQFHVEFLWEKSLSPLQYGFPVVTRSGNHRIFHLDILSLVCLRNYAHDIIHQGKFLLAHASATFLLPVMASIFTLCWVSTSAFATW